MRCEIQPPLKQDFLEELKIWFDASLTEFRENLKHLINPKPSSTSASQSLKKALQTIPYVQNLDNTNDQFKSNSVAYQLLERMGLAEHYLKKNNPTRCSDNQITTTEVITEW